jgi:hypothetical protein
LERIHAAYKENGDRDEQASVDHDYLKQTFVG